MCLILLIIDLIFSLKIAPESWPLDKNIVRAIVKGDSEDDIAFIKAKRLVAQNQKIIIFGDKFHTTTTELFFIRKVTNVERNIYIFLDETSFNNSFIFDNLNDLFFLHIFKTSVFSEIQKK